MIFQLIGKSLAQNALLKTELKGRTDEQKSIIKYFNKESGGCGGCLGGGLFGTKDKDFDNILHSHIGKLNIYEMALQKLGVDESQIKEIDPILLDGFFFDHPRFIGAASVAYALGDSVKALDKMEIDPIGTYVKKGADGVYRFSKYKFSYLLFSIKQLYIYSYRFDLTNFRTYEETVEFFYKDIDSIRVITKVNDRQIYGKGCLGFLDISYETFTYPELQITVPGASFSCSLKTENENTILGLKNLIREKKG